MTHGLSPLAFAQSLAFSSLGWLAFLSPMSPPPRPPPPSAMDLYRLCAAKISSKSRTAPLPPYVPAFARPCSAVPSAPPLKAVDRSMEKRRPAPDPPCLNTSKRVSFFEPSAPPLESDDESFVVEREKSENSSMKRIVPKRVAPPPPVQKDGNLAEAMKQQKKWVERNLWGVAGAGGSSKGNCSDVCGDHRMCKAMKQQKRWIEKNLWGISPTNRVLPCPYCNVIPVVSTTMTSQTLMPISEVLEEDDLDSLRKPPLMSRFLKIFRRRK